MTPPRPQPLAAVPHATVPRPGRSPATPDARGPGGLHRPDDPRAAVAAAVSVVLECLAGRRSLDQVRSRLPGGGLRVRTARHVRSPGRVRRLTVTRPSAHTCEAVATVVLDGRVAAVAVGLRRRERRWTVTAIEIG